MAAPSDTSENLEKLVTDLRSGSKALETFATTLHHKVQGLKWDGPAADKFRTAAKAQEAQMAGAVEQMTRLAARIQTLIDDAKTLQSKLSKEEAAILQRLEKQISDLEALAASTGQPVGQLISPQLHAELVKECQQYQSLSGRVADLGGI